MDDRQQARSRLFQQNTKYPHRMGNHKICGAWGNSTRNFKLKHARQIIYLLRYDYYCYYYSYCCTVGSSRALSSMSSESRPSHPLTGLEKLEVVSVVKPLVVHVMLINNNKNSPEIPRPLIQHQHAPANRAFPRVCPAHHRRHSTSLASSAAVINTPLYSCTIM